jgi:L-iditol 2-dehydrogenase
LIKFREVSYKLIAKNNQFTGHTIYKYRVKLELYWLVEMKAAVYYGINDLKVEDVETPKIGPGDILIKVKACGICGSDNRKLRKGSYNVVPPRILGHEVSGEVVETGSDVKDIKRGMRVTVAPSIGCGKCFFCKINRENLCKSRLILGVNIDGGFAEYLKIPASYLKAVVPFADHIPYEEAALTEPLACCLNGNLKINIKPGDTVAIIGDGPIGLMHLQLARLRGARAIMSGLVEHRLQKAKELGAYEAINSKVEDAVSRVKELTNGLGADSVIVAVGNVPAIEQGLKMVRDDGNVVLFGGCPPGTKMELDPNLIHYSEINVTGSIDCNLETFERALHLIEAGLIKTRPLITHKFGLDEILKGFDVADRLEGIKVLIIP